MGRSGVMGALLLGGCSNTEAAEAAGILGLAAAGLFVLALILVPIISVRLKEREHYVRMYKRRPFSKDDLPRRGRRNR